MSRETVLSLLLAHPGEYLSGAAMSRTLGVSRAAVWKAIEALRQEGYEITSAPNRGYRLESAPDRVREGELSGHLAGCLVGSRLLCLDTIDSTNTEAKRQAMAGAPEGLVVLAEEQTGGRGRLGRSFQSPPGTGIYLSFLLRPQTSPEQAVNLTACAAVAMCDAVEAACGLRPQIKWTNDILLARRKICGILTEMSVEGETGALQYIVLGIGVNVNQALDDFPEELRDLAGSVAMAAGHPIDRGRLAAEIINAVDAMYAGWKAGIRNAAQYRADCATLGRQVRLIRGGLERTAFAEDVDDQFGLVVRYEDGTRETVISGEVSVRGLEGYV